MTPLLKGVVSSPKTSKTGGRGLSKKLREGTGKNRGYVWFFHCLECTVDVSLSFPDYYLSSIIWILEQRRYCDNSVLNSLKVAIYKGFYWGMSKISTNGGSNITRGELISQIKKISENTFLAYFLNQLNKNGKIYKAQKLWNSDGNNTSILFPHLQKYSFSYFVSSVSHFGKIISWSVYLLHLFFSVAISRKVDI